MSTAFVSTHSGFGTPTLQRPSAAGGAVTAGGAKSRLRLTRRGRIVVTTLASVPLVAAALVGALNAGAASASGPGAPAHFDYVTVQSGQSLWSIAEKVAPNADPRDVIAAIVTLNGLHTATVVPGERLAMPTQYDGANH